MSRRRDVAMTPHEIRAFLDSQMTVILTTTAPNGYPHSVPMTCLSSGDLVFLFTSFRKAQKVRNIERDPRVSLLVETGVRYEELKGVLVQADAELLTDPEDVRRAMGTSGPSAAGIIDSEQRAGVDASMSKRAVIRCTPIRVMSWDHSKLPPGTY